MHLCGSTMYNYLLIEITTEFHSKKWNLTRIEMNITKLSLNMNLLVPISYSLFDIIQ